MTDHDFLLEAIRKTLAPPAHAGIAEGGHFIQVSMGHGFYIPEADFKLAQERANQLGKVQFVGLAHDGSAIHATREELHVDARCEGHIAWILPAPKGGDHA